MMLECATDKGETSDLNAGLESGTYWSEWFILEDSSKVAKLLQAVTITNSATIPTRQIERRVHVCQVH